MPVWKNAPLVLILWILFLNCVVHWLWKKAMLPPNGTPCSVTLKIILLPGNLVLMKEINGRKKWNKRGLPSCNLMDANRGLLLCLSNSWFKRNKNISLIFVRLQYLRLHKFLRLKFFHQ
jgi:hypothetical protein